MNSKPAKKAKIERLNGPNWLELPRDLIAKILQKLDVVQIVTSASQVCYLWWNICNDPFMWHMRTIVMSQSNFRSSPYDFVKICGYAIRRSHRHVEDIDIKHFGTDDLLIYIANSCTSNLRRLCFAHCGVIESDKALLEILKKSSLLEELDISFTCFRKLHLEDIGRCCPHLKVLKCNRVGIKFYWPDLGAVRDHVAVAIAKTMPQLRHLQIMGDVLSNNGLLAILNGCPLLEFLDIRACFYVDLGGSLGKKCHEQIKDLQLPFDEDQTSDDYRKNVIDLSFGRA